MCVQEFNMENFLCVQEFIVCVQEFMQLFLRRAQWSGFFVLDCLM